MPESRPASLLPCPTEPGATPSPVAPGHVPIRKKRISQLNKENPDATGIYVWDYANLLLHAWTKSEARAKVKSILKTKRLPVGANVKLVGRYENS